MTSTTYWSHNNGDLSQSLCQDAFEKLCGRAVCVLGLVPYKYIPVDHSMQKGEDPQHGRLIVGRAYDVNGIILSAIIAASRQINQTVSSVFL